MSPCSPSFSPKATYLVVVQGNRTQQKATGRKRKRLEFGNDEVSGNEGQNPRVKCRGDVSHSISPDQVPPVTTAHVREEAGLRQKQRPSRKLTSKRRARLRLDAGCQCQQRCHFAGTAFHPGRSRLCQGSGYRVAQAWHHCPLPCLSYKAYYFQCMASSRMHMSRCSRNVCSYERQKMMLIKNTRNNKCWGGCGEKGAPCTVGGKATRGSHCGSSAEVPQKMKNRITTCSSGSTTEYLPKEQENTNEKDTCNP